MALHSPGSNVAPSAASTWTLRYAARFFFAWAAKDRYEEWKPELQKMRDRLVLLNKRENFKPRLTTVVFTAPEQVQLWDLKSDKAHKLGVQGSQVAFTPDGSGLIVSGRFTVIGRNPGGPAFIQVGEESIFNVTRITWWDLSRGREVRRVERMGGSAVVSADGALVASCNGFEVHYGVTRWASNVIATGPEQIGDTLVPN